MNWIIIIIEAIVLTAAFTAMILILLVKNPVWWIADYPEDIQEEYFKTHERIPAKFFTPLLSVYLFWTQANNFTGDRILDSFPPHDGHVILSLNFLLA